MKQKLQLLIYIFLGALIRFWNYRNSLYFIYDQGRDALVLEKMAHGHMVAVGPTSGLAGFFLGPLWYYIGFPGYVLSGGNPYGICLWYIAISCLALPLYWYFAHKLFTDKFWVITCAVLLAIIPGSIQASIFIWNPLLSVPLMLCTLLCFWKSRQSEKFLYIGFLFLALTLQSEFAYAIFFVPIMVIAIPWLRKKFALRNFLIAGAIGAVTLLPQLAFEVRNHFVMTQAMIQTMKDPTQAISWSQLFSQRPNQLLDSTSEILFGPSNGPVSHNFWVILVGLALIGVWLKTRQDQSEPTFDADRKFLWQLTAIFTIIPFAFYLIWRGNHGYFFSYYMTAHFVFVLPMIILGMQQIHHFTRNNRILNGIAKLLIAAMLSFFLFASWQHWHNVVFLNQNNAGLAKIWAATQEIYRWQKEDGIQQATVRIYTANVSTEQYDYVLGWYARKYNITPPLTVRNGTEKRWYIMLVSGEYAQKIFFEPWYKDATAGGKKVRSDQIGVLTLETYEKL